MWSADIYARVEPNPANCSSEEHWVRSHSRNRNGQNEFVAAHCAKNPAGYKFWSKKFQSKRPKFWPWKQEKSKNWNIDEVEAVLIALGQIPQELWLTGVEGLYRMDVAKDKLNPAASGNGHIVLYDQTFRENRLSRIIVHELAHEQYRSLSKTDRRNYWYATGWMGKGATSGDLGDAAFISRSSGYVEEDGKSDPAEDYANNIEYFLFAPDTLKDSTPGAYSWIKDKFGDKFKLTEGAHNVAK